MYGVCQVKVCIFSLFSGNADIEVKDCEYLEENAAICRRWLRIYGPGAPLERVDPRQYVPGRGQLLFAAGKAQPDTAAAAAALERGDRGGNYHNGGAAGRAADQPGLQRLGLPASAGQFPRPDLLAFFSALDSGELGSNGALRKAGWNHRGRERQNA